MKILMLLKIFSHGVLMKGFKTLVSAGDAVSIVLNNIDINLESEYVGLQDSLGRHVSEDIFAQYDVPPFDRSAVDGFALRSTDVISASYNNPVELRVVGKIYAGSDVRKIPKLREGEAVKIFTGAPIPEGADAVVMIEQAREVGDKVYINRPVAPLQNISRRGEDLRRGDLILRRGDKIRPWHIGILASQNIVKIPVYRKIRIGLLSTGSELVEPGEEIDFESGKIINSSKPMLMALIRDEGCEPIDLGTVPDDIDIIRNKILENIDKIDMMITTGGSSVGEQDLVAESIKTIDGHKILFHGVRIRPGRPAGLALVREKPVLMFSGFPVAALVEFQLLIHPLIKKIYRAREDPKPLVRARLTRRIANPPNTRSFVRVRVFEKDDKLYAEPLAITGSGILSTLVKGNGILIINEDLEGYDEDQEVEIELINYIFREQDL